MPYDTDAVARACSIRAKIVIGDNSFDVNGEVRDVRALFDRWVQALGGDTTAEQDRLNVLTQRLKASNDRLALTISTYTPKESR